MRTRQAFDPYGRIRRRPGLMTDIYMKKADLRPARYVTRGGDITSALGSAASVILPVLASYVANEGVKYVADKIEKRKKPTKRPVTKPTPKPMSKPKPSGQKQIAPISKRSKAVLSQMVLEGRGMNYF